MQGSNDARALRIQYRRGESLRTKTPAVVSVDVDKLGALASAGWGDVEYSGAATLTRSKVVGSGTACKRQP